MDNLNDCILFAIMGLFLQTNNINWYIIYDLLIVKISPLLWPVHVTKRP